MSDIIERLSSRTLTNEDLIAEIKRRIDTKGIEDIRLFDVSTARFHNSAEPDPNRRLPDKGLLNCVFPFLDHDTDSINQQNLLRFMRGLSDDDFRALRIAVRDNEFEMIKCLNEMVEEGILDDETDRVEGSQP